jgi:endoglycosylceramidase
MRRNRSIAALGVIALLGLTGAQGAGARSSLPRLHAESGESPAIVAADGRQVLLRGVNDNQLGDYFQQRPDIPATAPLTRADMASISALGMNSVRLIVHWSRLEPSRGAFDAAYLAEIRRAVRWARERGMYVILDMHQDAWGKYIASPKDETCAPGFVRQQGWDGAPEWATLTDGLPTCRFGVREIAPAVGQAWQSFYADRDGIQGELVATWARLARAFAADPTVAGYDLLNEPNTGYAPGVTDATSLGLFYRRAIESIRSAERSAKGGFSHIAFFEPGVLWSALAADATPPPPVIDDPNVVFAPHLYADSISLDRAVLGSSVVSIGQGFDIADAAARQYGTTAWIGEWGWFGDPAADEAKIREYARQEDAHRWGGAWWQWRQACGDPHDFGDGDSTEAPKKSGNLFVVRCPDGTALAMPPTTVAILSRPYPRVAPGRVTGLESDPARRLITVRGSDPDAHGSCELDLWVPGNARPAVTAASGVRRVRAARARGGWRVRGCARGDYSLTVR